MITSGDRSYWIGASDTDKVVGNWNTKTWRAWWDEKLGITPCGHWQNKYTMAGTNYEHAVLRSLGIPLTLDHQVKIPELRLRVNFDGIAMRDDPPHIYECKTYKGDKEFKVSKTYWRQAQTEMFALGTDVLDIAAYAMEEENYENYFLPIDKNRLTLIRVERDNEFIDGLLVPRLKILAECLEEGKYPRSNAV